VRPTKPSKPGDFRRDVQRATWIDRLTDDDAQEAAVRALVLRRRALDEGAPERALKSGDKMLDDVRIGKLDGARARRKLEAALHRFALAHSAAYKRRVHCPCCGTLVHPGTTTIPSVSGRFYGALDGYVRVLNQLLHARLEAGGPLSPRKEAEYLSRLESLWQSLDPSAQGEAYKHGPNIRDPRWAEVHARYLKAGPDGKAATKGRRA
jgi:hypothetical protein